MTYAEGKEIVRDNRVYRMTSNRWVEVGKVRGPLYVRTGVVVNGVIIVGAW